MVKNLPGTIYEGNLKTNIIPQILFVNELFKQLDIKLANNCI